MAWIGIDESGLEFSFQSSGGATVTMAGSVVSAADVTGPVFEINLISGPVEPPVFRVTVQAYEAGNPSGQVGNAEFILSSENPQVIVENQQSPANPQEAFTPAQFSGDCRVLSYTGSSGSEWSGIESFSFLIEVETADEVSYNCECDDDYPRSTLLQMRTRLLRRLGYSAQAATPPPGMAELLDDFLQQAQELLYRKYAVFRTERFFTWNLEPGVRFYDLEANRDECTKKLDPRKVTWVGISQGDDSWQPIGCGIDPAWYTSNHHGVPERYEIRQCIEIWPYPADDTWQLRVKGHFGLLPFVAPTDFTTIDPEAIFLLALANAKAHEGHSDAKNYVDQLTGYIGDLIAGSHHTRRYLPGARVLRNRPMPRLKDVP